MAAHPIPRDIARSLLLTGICLASGPFAAAQSREVQSLFQALDGLAKQAVAPERSQGGTERVAQSETQRALEARQARRAAGLAPATEATPAPAGAASTSPEAVSQAQPAPATAAASNRPDLSTTARGFEVKGVTLATSQQALVAMAPGKGGFQCAASSEPLLTDCAATFEPPNTCIPQVYDTPKGPMQRNECRPTPWEVTMLAPGMQKLGSFAGQKVSQVNISYFAGRVAFVRFYVATEGTPALQALTEKYGAPDSTVNGTSTWSGKGERLSLGRGGVVLQNPEVMAAWQAETKALASANAAATAGQKRNEQEKRRADF